MSYAAPSWTCKWVDCANETLREGFVWLAMPRDYLYARRESSKLLPLSFLNEAVAMEYVGPMSGKAVGVETTAGTPAFCCFSRARFKQWVAKYTVLPPEGKLDDSIA